MRTTSPLDRVAELELRRRAFCILDRACFYEPEASVRRPLSPFREAAVWAVTAFLSTRLYYALARACSF
jgi:hypothetical protein